MVLVDDLTLPPFPSRVLYAFCTEHRIIFMEWTSYDPEPSKLNIRDGARAGNIIESEIRVDNVQVLCRYPRLHVQCKSTSAL